MVDLVLRPSTIDPAKPWALQLRWHESVGPTEYFTLARLGPETADEVIRAGAAFHLFDAPEATEVDLKAKITALEAEVERLRSASPSQRLETGR